ncbi:unnamed protein product, partial [Rotaria sp. Silwood1]
QRPHRVRRQRPVRVRHFL